MSHSAGDRFQQLVDIMRALRAPDGCPWDREQTLRSLRPFVLEETYELLDALDHGDYDGLRQEIGDFVLEAVFLSQICEEDGRFTVADALQAIIDKLVRRHPHVDLDRVLSDRSDDRADDRSDGRSHGRSDGRSDDRGGPTTAGQVKERWEDIKKRERATDGRAEHTVLSGVPRAMPSLLRAYELSTRAATVGFDWVRTTDVLDKIEEEVREVREAIERHGPGAMQTEEEMGDLFFAMANLARKLGIEPEAALRVANDKFQRRFDAIERAVTAEGLSLKDLTLDELEARWQVAKQATNRNTKDTKDMKNRQ